jgi:hypothetical protein
VAKERKRKEIHLFLLTVGLVIRSETVCESAASIPNQRIHDNGALDHESLDEGVMLHWNVPSLYLADSFVKSSSSNKYFFRFKEEHWIFFKKPLGEIFGKIFLGEEIFDFLEDSAPLVCWCLLFTSQTLIITSTHIRLFYL